MASAHDTKLAVLENSFENRKDACDREHADLRKDVGTNTLEIKRNQTDINRLRWFVAGVGASLSLMVGAITTILGMLVMAQRLGWF